ncbi:hypothetical protein KAU40_01775 [Candidatus Parcubacteria bacterium]|nr:hypothetical protein [Candidatus Parcubacteria bacterium]
MFNYQKTCQNLLKDLPERQKIVISRRFALSGEPKRETLESIGQGFGITRERVRQIEKDGFSKIKQKIDSCKPIFLSFKKRIHNSGDFKKESLLLKELGKEKQQAQVYFLLTLAQDFERFQGSKDLDVFWTTNQKTFNLAEKVVAGFCAHLKKINKPISLKELKKPFSLSPAVLTSYLEISKNIQQNSEGLFGLKDWPEINPRGVRDNAYLVLLKTKQPLHFNQITKLIDKALPQTVHNELIKDPRFVLVGRGIYGLRAWGYEPGLVKDVIFKVLKTARAPLTKHQILSQVFKQRFVKENTILLNLSNRKYFSKNLQGKYQIRET